MRDRWHHVGLYANRCGSAAIEMNRTLVKLVADRARSTAGTMRGLHQVTRNSSLRCESTHPSRVVESAPGRSMPHLGGALRRTSKFLASEICQAATIPKLTSGLELANCRCELRANCGASCPSIAGQSACRAVTNKNPRRLPAERRHVMEEQAHGPTGRKTQCVGIIADVREI